MNDEVDFPGLLDITDTQSLSGGDFSSWLERAHTVLNNQNAADVPCGKCNACCRSSYFIHIEPDEIQTLARIPGEVLFIAPGRPEGHLLMGYDESGNCPMLIDESCSIYEHRPRTCRAYDCRVFAAAGTSAGGPEKALITKQVNRWKFKYSSELAIAQSAALKAAAEFLRLNANRFPDNVLDNPSQLAVIAIKAHALFFTDTEASDQVPARTEMELVDAIETIIRSTPDAG